MNIRTNILLRVYAAFGLIVLFAIAVIAKMGHVQMVEGDKYRAMADSLSTKYMEVEAARGNIYSADGSLLATSVPEYEIRMDLLAGGIEDDKVFYDKVDSLAYNLSKHFKDKTSREYSRLLKNARVEKQRYFLIKRKVSYQDLKALKTFPMFNMGRYKGGLIAVQQNKRIFPFKDLAARTIGYYNENAGAAVGLEGAYGDYINGETGKRLVQRIAGGVWMPVNEDAEIAPKDGADIISTIDINIQDLAQSALKKQLTKSAADFGTVVVMEVETGRIKAIANYTKDEKSGEYKEKFNYAIAQSAEPGSTFKLASYMVAMDDKKFGLDDKIDTEGGKYKVHRHTIKDSHEGGYGVITMKKAFEVSSNVAIVKQIHNNYKDKPSAFTDKLHEMKLGEKMGLQIPGEGLPLIKTPKSKSWSGLTLPQMAYGYELKMTPIEILALYNAVANNGKMIAPVFVQEIRRLGNTVEQFKPRVINNKVCSDKTLAMLKEMLEGVVEEGTGKALKNPLYKIAGKTGTAQVADGKSGYRKRKYQASFCGYFPAEKPKYSMIVVVQNPTKGSYYAADVAGPVFREVADMVYASDLQMYANVEEPKIVGNTRMPKVKEGHKKAAQKVYNALGIKPYFASARNIDIDTNGEIAPREIRTGSGTVPDVSGMGLRDALYVLGNAGLVPIVKGSGEVYEQSLPAGEKVIKGTKIIIELR